MPRRRRGAMLAAHVLLSAATLVIVFPMLYAVQLSTLEFQEVFVFPPKLLPGAAFTDNLQRAWEKVHLGRLLANSAGIAVAVALGKTCLSVLAAFAFTYFRDFPGKTLLFVAILVMHMLQIGRAH